MALADGGLYGPDFGGREHAGKGRVLAQAAPLLSVGTKDLANFSERAFENGHPFAVAADEGGSVVLPQPTGEIVAGDLQKRGLLAEPGGDPPSHLQADFVVYLVFHGRKTSTGFYMLKVRKPNNTIAIAFAGRLRYSFGQNRTCKEPVYEDNFSSR